MLRPGVPAHRSPVLHWQSVLWGVLWSVSPLPASPGVSEPLISTQLRTHTHLHAHLETQTCTFAPAPSYEHARVYTNAHGHTPRNTCTGTHRDPSTDSRDAAAHKRPVHQQTRQGLVLDTCGRQDSETGPRGPSADGGQSQLGGGGPVPDLSHPAPETSTAAAGSFYPARPCPPPQHPSPPTPQPPRELRQSFVRLGVHSRAAQRFPQVVLPPD